MKKSVLLLVLSSMFVISSCQVDKGPSNPTPTPGAPEGEITPTPSVATLVSISETHTKNTYYVGEEIDKTDLVVTAHYSDQSSKAVTDYQISFDSSTPTTSSLVTVSYQEKETTFNVAVYTVPEEGDYAEGYVSINDGKKLQIEVGATEYLTASYEPTSIYDRYISCEWSSSNESALKMERSDIGRVKGVGEGVASVSIHIVLDDGTVYKDTALVYVVKAGSEVQTRYERVDDLDTLTTDDVIVFACPEYSKGANITRVDGALGSSNITFSSDKQYITSMSEDIGEYIISGENIETDEGIVEVFTLECYQNGKYLSAKNFKNIAFVNSKGNLTWGFETQENKHYVYPTLESIEGWLMFNITADKFTIYDSNELVDKMVLPTIYKLTKY